MRKQTKLVAVLSAAALLAMGASMTSFAAGWEKDDAGVWHYYDKDDEMVTGEWRKDGAKWFYLDDEGDMLYDSWVDDEYYVGSDGAMLINQWAKTITDDSVDDPDDDGEHWFYFGSKGKKVADDKKRINGKTYYFNQDGEMRDGWYQPDGSEDVYYLGGEDEGGRAENQWLWLECPTDDDTDDGEWVDPDGEDCSKCDDEGWYWFGSDGKMYKDSKKKTINGRYYYFNNHGQMLYEWINTKSDGVDGEKANANDGVYAGSDKAASASEAAKASGSEAVANLNNQIVGSMIYANQVEDGSRINGWREIEGSEDAGTDGDTDWYFFDDGEAEKAKMSDKVLGATDGDDDDPVYRARIKCDGKYFCFNEVGQMQTGLQYIPKSEAFYYFDDNGYMKTGKVSDVEEEDNDLYNYYFITKSGGNGKGQTGEKDGYLYWNGKRLEADDDYRFYVWNGNVYLVNNKGKIQKSSKTVDLEGVDEEKVVVTIKKSIVQSYKAGDTEVDLTDADTIAKEVLDEHVFVPYISIYNNIIHSNELGYGKYISDAE